MKLNKLLINGGCGFLGSNLAQYALKNGIELVAFDNLEPSGSCGQSQMAAGTGRIQFHQWGCAQCQ